MKKYPSTQEMANIYPPWSKVRTDDQSVGYGLINTIARPIHKMDKSLSNMRKNIYLPTANLDEIDLVYRTLLPTTFEFDTDNSDPLRPCPLPPTVVGNPGTDNFSVLLAQNNRLEEMWYESVPNRFSLAGTETSLDHNLITFTASDSPLDVALTHHLGGGRLWIEAGGGTEYLKIVDGEVRRAKVIIRGKTRKGTEESETIIFPWDMKQPSQKEWDTIDKIEVYDVEDDVQISIASGDFNRGPYLDHYNLEYSPNRRKIDTFWDMGEIEGHPTIDMIRYVSDEWELLALGFSERDIVESWELIDENDNTVTGVDIAIQPFTERAWVATADARLYLYDLSQDTVSGIDALKDKTVGSHVQFDYETRYLVRDENFVFIPWHARPIKEIISYRLSYRTPSGTKFGLKDGATVSFTSDFLVKGEQLTRTIADQVTVPLTERGEYLFVLEATFIDGVEHTEKIVVRANFKKPLASFDVSAEVPFTVSGVDFDSDQKLWLTTTGGHHRIDFNTDQMIIDYNQKIIYFKEEYDSVDITTP